MSINWLLLSVFQQRVIFTNSDQEPRMSIANDGPSIGTFDLENPNHDEPRMKMIDFLDSNNHEKFVWDARMEPGVLKALESLWGTEELLVSFDSLNITFPNRKDIPLGSHRSEPVAKRSILRTGHHQLVEFWARRWRPDGLSRLTQAQ